MSRFRTVFERYIDEIVALTLFPIGSGVLMGRLLDVDDEILELEIYDEHGNQEGTIHLDARQIVTICRNSSVLKRLEARIVQTQIKTDEFSRSHLDKCLDLPAKMPQGKSAP